MSVDETVRWLATALAQMREANPADRPVTAQADLDDAFTQLFRAPRLVDDLVRQVWELSVGTVALQRGDMAEFHTAFRGPAEYLVLSARKRVSLVPDADSPVRFDSGQGIWTPLR